MHPASPRARLHGLPLALVLLGLAGTLIGPPAAAAGATTLTAYGREGSFGTLPGSGAAVTTVGVPGWTFLPGQAAYGAVVAGDGRVVIANEPQTDDQSRPTATTMALSVFDPVQRRLRTKVVPTSAGQRSATAPGRTVGGADIGGLALSATDPLAVTFVSSVPYHGWELEGAGQFPSVGTLRRTGDSWSYDALSSRSGDALQATAPAVHACPWKVVAHDCNGLSDLAALPGGGFVAAQYFGETDHESGGLVVLGPDGALLSAHHLPQVLQPDGTTAAARPRLVTVDPSQVSRSGATPVAVVYDVMSGGTLLPGLLQVFSVQASTGLLRPTTGLLRPTDGGPGQGYEHARYGAKGELWTAEARSGTLVGGQAGLFRRGSPAGRCPASAATPSPVVLCAPDLTAPALATAGLVRSMTQDPGTGAMVLATLSGVLQVLRSNGTALTAAPPVDLGLSELVDREAYWVGPRQGAVDPRTRTLWLPVQQLSSPAVCAAQPCAPQALDQWLYAVDLRGLQR